MKNVSSVRKLSKCMYQVTQNTSAQLFLGECRFGSAVTEQPGVERLEKTQGLIFFRIEEQGDGCNALSHQRALMSLSALYGLWIFGHQISVITISVTGMNLRFLHKESW